MPARQLPEHWPVHSDWTAIMSEFFDSRMGRELFQFIQQERAEKQVFPSAADVFNAFAACPIQATKVVILGQDPYHAAGQAHGLCFSVRDGVPLPPSLKNIFKELNSDLGIDNGARSDLTPWARQGVLLLNTVLTVECGRPRSHRHHGWEELTDLAIKKLARQNRCVVFVFWGKSAARKACLVSRPHRIIESAHPSPLSAYRGFHGSKPFSTINRYLSETGSSPIDWRLQ